MVDQSINLMQALTRDDSVQNIDPHTMNERLPDMIGLRPRVLFWLENNLGLHLVDYIGERHFLIKPATEAHLYICELLRTSISVIDLAKYVNQRFPKTNIPHVQQFLSVMHNRRLIEDRSTALQSDIAPTELTRYDRQLRYFSFFENSSTNRYQMQTNLKAATVAIIGLGGVGNWVAWHLAAMGVGRLVLVDHDRVELSNLNRQVLYAEKDIGDWKVDTAVRRLKGFNPDLSVEPFRRRITAPEDVRDVVKNASTVVLTADQPRVLIRRWVNEVCVGLKLPYIQGSLDAYLLQIGPMYFPYSTGCYACRETEMHAQNPDLNESQVRAFMQASRRYPPLIGPLCGFVGASVALDVVRYLAGHEIPATTGKYYLIDARKWNTRVLPVKRLENCPICGNNSLPLSDTL